MIGAGRDNRTFYGKYRLLAELGQGGTSHICLAVAQGPNGFNKLVVLKLLKPELAEDEDCRNMFLNEARLAARLRHPNVVQTNEIFEENGRPVIVMEYLEGAPLSKLLLRSREAERSLSVPMHLRIICEVLNGLHYSHELKDYDGTPLGVVHRDMTPQNIFISFDGRVTLLDFGIAKLTVSVTETQAGVLKGKIRYMAPEQILGETVDRRTDIFAAGILFWEAIAQEKMWRDLPDTTVMHNIVNGIIPSPRTTRPDVPERLEAICMKALALNPSDRYATAAELQSDLEDWLSEHPVTNRTIGCYVGSLFSDVRVRTGRVIEQQLGTTPPEGSGSSRTEERFAQTADLTFAASAENAPGADTITQIAKTLRRARSLWFVAAGLAVIGGIFLARHFRTRPPIVIAEPLASPMAGLAPPPIEPAPPAAPPPPAVETAEVALKLSATPSTAKIFIDGRALPTNPYSGNVTWDPASHSVRAEAPGYSMEERHLAFASDTQLTLKLKPARPGPRAQAAPRTPTSQPTTAPAKPEPSINCDPPYVIDPEGIRRLRPECVSAKGG